MPCEIWAARGEAKGRRTESGVKTSLHRRLHCDTDQPHEPESSQLSESYSTQDSSQSRLKERSDLKPNPLSVSAQVM